MEGPYYSGNIQIYTAKAVGFSLASQVDNGRWTIAAVQKKAEVQGNSHPAASSAREK